MKGYRKLISNLITYAIVIIAFVLCEMILENMIPGIKMTRMYKNQLVNVCAYIVLAVSLNLVVGISGELSLGHAGFMSIGVFSGVVIATWLEKTILTINEKGKTVPFFSDTAILVITIIVAGAIAAFAGFLIGIPALRLRGDYLAIVLLAFGEIIRNVLNCVQVAVKDSVFHFALKINENSGLQFVPRAKDWIIHDTQGTKNAVMSVAFNNERFIVGFILVLFTLFVVLNLINSRSGRAIMAIRDNRIAAESVGLNVMKYKMMAFVTGAALAGMAGALYGLNIGSLKSEVFDYNKSIELLVIVVLGGIGSIRGSVIAAVLLTLLPDWLRQIGADDYRLLIYAAVLIVVMLATNSPILKNLWATLMRIEPLKKAADWVQAIPSKVRGLIGPREAAAAVNTESAGQEAAAVEADGEEGEEQ